MTANNPQSVDRSYKFMYKLLGILFHRYLYREGETIEFIETELHYSGQRKDICAKIDGKIIRITEFMAKALYSQKLSDISDYHILTRTDPEYDDYYVKTGVLSIANPNHGINEIDIDDNLTFHVNTLFTQNKNGWKVLSTLVYKTIIHKELSDEEAIDLLILPDMDIKLPIRALMKIIIVLIGHANIPNKDLKRKITLCEVQVLARFFTDDDLSEMIEMLKTETKNPDIQAAIDKYGPGFDVIYIEGYADGKTEGFNDGFDDGKIHVARNLLAKEVDEDIISESTGLSLKQLKELKEKL